MATRETTLPSIPDPNMIAGINEDLRSCLSAIKEIIEIREGRRANDDDRVVIRKDLARIGINKKALDTDQPSYDFTDEGIIDEKVNRVITK